VLWAKVAVVGGLVLVLAGFGLGVEPSSVTVDGHTYSCGSAIPQSWLMAGAEPGQPERHATARERRQAAACDAATRGRDVSTLGMLALGSLLALVGWTALRERGLPVPAQPGLGRV
jgi:hypothetical protein